MIVILTNIFPFYLYMYRAKIIVIYLSWKMQFSKKIYGKGLQE
jgi:hypothetical protein